jgi:predicted kinase
MVGPGMPHALVENRFLRRRRLRMTERSRPALIIVGGAPASGKSGLAEDLGSALGLPVFSRDAFKEQLLDTLGASDDDDRHRLGAAAYAVLHVALAKLIDAGVSVIVESNFSRGLGEPDFRGLVSKSRAVQIVCEAAPGEILRRYKKRAESGKRHPGHEDADAATLADLDESIEAGRYEPLDLDIPLLRVDTTDDPTPDIDTILQFIKAETRRNS